MFKRDEPPSGSAWWHRGGTVRSCEYIWTEGEFVFTSVLIRRYPGTSSPAAPDPDQKPRQKHTKHLPHKTNKRKSSPVSFCTPSTSALQTFGHHVPPHSLKTIKISLICRRKTYIERKDPWGLAAKELVKFSISKSKERQQDESEAQHRCKSRAIKKKGRNNNQRKNFLKSHTSKFCPLPLHSLSWISVHVNKHVQWEFSSGPCSHYCSLHLTEMCNPMEVQTLTHLGGVTIITSFIFFPKAPAAGTVRLRENPKISVAGFLFCLFKKITQVLMLVEK